MQGSRVWALAPDAHAYLPYLRAAGCHVQSSTAVEPGERDRLRDSIRQCDVVLLMADAAANCRVARLIRSLNLPVDMVAVMGQTGPGELTAFLQVGMDWVMRPGDSPALLLAILRALRQRRLESSADTVPDIGLSIGPWSLEDHAWRLRHRDGAGLRLTVSERAILLCLFESPGHIASHPMLTQALSQAWQHAYGRQSHGPKPRGIISRLRWRGLQAGMEPPIEALRGYGYLWVL